MPKEILKKNSEKGAFLYYAVIITSLLLAIALGLGTILISQIKGLKEMGNSAIAFFAADTGMEHILYLDKECYKFGCSVPPCISDCQGLSVNYSTSSNISGATYYARIPHCYTFQSKGKFRDTTRAVESICFSYKIVFTTSVNNGNLGGVSGADAICNTRAIAAGLPGTYKAWITDTDVNNQPSTRFATASVPYIRTDCVIVAANWADLTDGKILAPINMNESGVQITDGSFVFTNTTSTGERISNEPGFTCQNWTMSAPGLKAYYGIISQSELDADWTAADEDNICDSPGYIYCFQQ